MDLEALCSSHHKRYCVCMHASPTPPFNLQGEECCTIYAYGASFASMVYIEDAIPLLPFGLKPAAREILAHSSGLSNGVWVCMTLTFHRITPDGVFFSPTATPKRHLGTGVPLCEGFLSGSSCWGDRCLAISLIMQDIMLYNTPWCYRHISCVVSARV